MALSIRELAAARLQKASKSGGSKVDYSKIKFKPEIGKDYQVRILPNKYSPEYPIQELEIHQYDTFGKSVVALSSYGEKDPIVKYAEDLWKDVNKAKKTGDPALPDLEKEAKGLGFKLKPKTRYFAQVIIRGEESKGPLIWEFGTNIATVIDSLLLKEDFCDLWDVQNGTDLEVTGIEATMKNNNTGKVTTYPSVTVTPRRKSTVLDKDEELVEKWLEDQKDPATVLYKTATYEELKDMLRKFLDPQDEEDDDIKPPVRKSLPMAPAKAPTKRVVEESDEDEEEQAPEPPKKNKPIAEAPKKKPVVVEEEEDEEETDDLPFKAPPKKTSKKVVEPEYDEEADDELSEAIPKVKGKAPVAKPAPAKKVTAAPKFNSALFEDDDEDGE